MGKIKLGFGVLVLLLSSQAKAAILHVDEEGFLLGASNVIVGWDVYDVTFRQRGDRTPIVFTTSSDANKASLALLNQVLVGPYDIRPGYVKFCPGEGDDPAFRTLCETYTPYRREYVEDFSYTAYWASVARNIDESMSLSQDSFYDNEADYDRYRGSPPWSFPEDENWAEWTYVSPVPVPAAIWLFGTALIGLVGFSRRKKIFLN